MLRHDSAVWLVTDPKYDGTTITDILCRTTLAGVCLQSKGGLSVECEHAALYRLPDEEAARADAEQRLAAWRAR